MLKEECSIGTLKMSGNRSIRRYRELPAIPPDIEVAQSAELQPISKIGVKAGLFEEEIESYGLFKAKINEGGF